MVRVCADAGRVSEPAVQSVPAAPGVRVVHIGPAGADDSGAPH